MSSKPRHKKYRPRPVHVAGGLLVIAKACARGQDAAPLVDDQRTDLGLAYWLSMEQLRTGDATEEAWSCVVSSLNIAMALAEDGVGDEYEKAIVRALDGAFRAKVRSATSGNFRLDGEAIRAIDHALEVHDAQLAEASRAQIVAALHLVRQRIEEGNVYTIQN